MAIFAGMPVYVIHLARQAERREGTLELFHKVGLKQNLQFLEAIDGEYLLRSGGRVTFKKTPGKNKTEKTLALLSYDTFDEKRQELHRVSQVLHPTRLGTAGGTDLWAQLGCARSHYNAMRLLKSVLSESESYALLCEDDCVLGPATADKPEEFLRELQSCVEALNEKYKNWCCLMLGGQPMRWARNEPSTIEGIKHATSVSQGHCSLWRYTPETSKILDEICLHIDSGMLNDVAVIACQKKAADRFFYASPAFIEQSKSLASTLQLVSKSGGQRGYNNAWKLLCSSGGSEKVKSKAKANLPKAQKRLLGPRGRGDTNISRIALHKMRAAIASKGGRKRAGNSSSASAISAKEAKMQQHFRKHGRWPTRAQAQAKWRISNSLWARIRSEGAAD
ncbi:unnamed protein product [Symbiodinium natans]|uniref:Glycosyl transferase family 25 domain-containing protein n=1 Tax=Symbiodinium natans TaxID=878477 RepID=A0A812KUA9_9DINO|nr:unnamed protein product [Symbiodinium natans]